MEEFRKKVLSLLLICMLYLCLQNSVDLFAKTYCNIGEIGDPQHERQKLFHSPVLPQIKFMQFLFISIYTFCGCCYM